MRTIAMTIFALAAIGFLLWLGGIAFKHEWVLIVLAVVFWVSFVVWMKRLNRKRAQ